MLPDPGGPGAPHARSQAQAAQAAPVPSRQGWEVALAVSRCVRGNGLDAQGGVTPPMQTPSQPAPVRHQAKSQWCLSCECKDAGTTRVSLVGRCYPNAVIPCSS